MSLTPPRSRHLASAPHRGSATRGAAGALLLAGLLAITAAGCGSTPSGTGAGTPTATSAAPSPAPPAWSPGGEEGAPVPGTASPGTPGVLTPYPGQTPATAPGGCAPESSGAVCTGPWTATAGPVELVVDTIRHQPDKNLLVVELRARNRGSRAVALDGFEVLDERARPLASGMQTRQVHMEVPAGGAAATTAMITLRPASPPAWLRIGFTAVDGATGVAPVHVTGIPFP